MFNLACRWHHFVEKKRWFSIWTKHTRGKSSLPRWNTVRSRQLIFGLYDDELLCAANEDSWALLWEFSRHFLSFSGERRRCRTNQHHEISEKANLLVHFLGNGLKLGGHGLNFGIRRANNDLLCTLTAWWHAMCNALVHGEPNERMNVNDVAHWATSLYRSQTSLSWGDTRKRRCCPMRCGLEESSGMEGRVLALGCRPPGYAARSVIVNKKQWNM